MQRPLHRLGRFPAATEAIDGIFGRGLAGRRGRPRRGLAGGVDVERVGRDRGELGVGADDAVGVLRGLDCVGFSGGAVSNEVRIACLSFTIPA